MPPLLALGGSDGGSWKFSGSGWPNPHVWSCLMLELCWIHLLATDLQDGFEGRCAELPRISVSQSCQSYVTRKDNLPDSDGYWIRRSDQQQMFFCRQQIPAYRWTKLWRTRKWTTNSASFAAAAPLVSAAASCAGSHCQRMAGQSWGGWLTYRKIMKNWFSPRSCLWNLGKMIVSFRM